MSTTINLTAVELNTVASQCLELLKVYAHSPAFALNPAQASEDIKDVSVALYNAARAQVTKYDLYVLEERTESLLEYNEQTDVMLAICDKYINSHCN